MSEDMPDKAHEVLADLAGTMEHHESRLSRLESPHTTTGSSTNTAEADESSGDGGDRRVRVRRRGPLRRRRHVAGRTTNRNAPPAGWCAEEWSEFAAWVERLRSQELHDHIPADWEHIPLVVAELRALRWAWLSAERSTRPSFEWVYWHDALGRSLGRIEEWKATHQRHCGLSAMPSPGHSS